MELTKSKKIKLDKKEALVRVLSSHKDFVISNFVGISVADQTKLRTRLRAKNSVLKVVKNNLFYLALKEVGSYEHVLENVEKDLKGPVSVAFVNSEFSSVSKVLLDYSKDVEGFTLKSGCLDGVYLSLSDVKDVANLPSREELLTMIARGLNAPVTKIARGMKEVMTSLALAIEAVAKKKNNDGSGANE